MDDAHINQVRLLFQKGHHTRSSQRLGSLEGLDRSADKATTWLAVAAVLALVDGRFGRRAAMRGLLSVALASAAANGSVERFTRGRRRLRRSGARWRPRLPGPAAPWFPSQSARAFAFATGAAQELPALGAPLAGVACLLGYSRVRAGSHRLLHVLGGAAMGVGAGLATRRLWPVAPHDGAEAGVALAPATVEASPDGEGVVIVVNASAGQGGGAGEEAKAALPAAEVVGVDDGAGMEAALKDAAERAAVIGVAGGDGSVNTAAGLAADAGKPLLVLPAGTLNHFAAALGINSVAEAADAVRAGRAVNVDRGIIAGHTFVNTASLGSYCDLVDAREKLEGRIGKWPAVVVALWRVLRRARPVEVEIDGQPRSVWMIFIGNCRYHPAGFAPSWRERLDDGTLDVRIVDGARPWSRAQLLFSVLTGRLARCRAYEQRFLHELSIRSREGPLRLARDGETFDGPEAFMVSKADKPLLVYAPGS